MRIDASDQWCSAHVELFQLRPEHVGPSYVGWLNDPEVNRYLESRFVTHDLDSTRHYVRQMLDSEVDLFLGIRCRVLGRHVGNIKLGPIDRQHGRGEIGLMIGDREAWGRGIATEAIGLIAAIGERELGLRKMTAGCYASNIGSAKAFQRCGFAVEGIRRGHFLLDGQPEDLILLGRMKAAPAATTGGAR